MTLSKTVPSAKKPQTIAAMQKQMQTEYSQQNDFLARKHGPNCAESWFLAMFAAAADWFCGWVQADVFTVKLHPEYPGKRLSGLVAWLQKLPATEYPKARENVLKRLKALEGRYSECYQSWSDLFVPWWEPCQHDSEHPKGELPVFDQTDEGQITEEWFCYCGALLFLNRACGYRLVDLEAKS